MLARNSAAKHSASISAKGISTPRADWIGAGGTADGSGSKSLNPAGSIIVQTVTKVYVF